ncbi:alpha/beta fold hydrolase, partial [Streptomyces sp. PRKS01-29]|nr:alpha/beta fold hydrolase [Streptomyces sabulosicollis]
MTGRTAALALTTAATASLLGVASANASPGALADPTAAALDWGACEGTGLDPRQECATVEVPLDHRDPGGKRISLAVSRIPSERPQARRGTLLLIPGGPGSPGLARPTTLGKRLPKPVRDAYDLVSFDPRGMGKSTHTGCDLNPADLSLLASRPWP